MTSPNPIDRITVLTSHTESCDTDRFALDDEHDLNSRDLRELLIALVNGDDRHDVRPAAAADFDELADLRPASADFDELADLVTALLADQYRRDDLSHLLMQYSLCPVHAVDWAICFDDQDPECEQVRAVFPHGHDT